MSTQSMISESNADLSDDQANPARHLWMHFTRMGNYATKPPPIIERGEGAYIWDTNGRRYLDGLSGLFVVQAGHGRASWSRLRPRRRESWPSSPSGPMRIQRQSSWLIGWRLKRPAT